MDPYFPDKPITMRAAESRMGSGKGHLSIGLQSLNRGKCSKITGVNETIARNALRNAGHKMPVKLKL
jgi:large subunit ribosomal protein L16